MVLVFLDDAIFARRRFVTSFSGRNVRFPDEMFAFVKIGALFVEMNDDFRRAFKITTVPVGAPRVGCSERRFESVRNNPALRFQLGLHFCAARAKNKRAQAKCDSIMRSQDHKGAHSSAPGQGFNSKAAMDKGPREIGCGVQLAKFEPSGEAMSVRMAVLVLFLLSSLV
jgi:hypothetical protein